MANPLYGQNKNDDALDLVNSSNGDVLQIASNPAVSGSYELIADAANDTTISALACGKEYYFGTTTGAVGASDGDSAFTLQLPVPKGAGEKIKVTCLTAAAYAKLLGISNASPAAVTMTYIVYEAGAVVETATTAAGVDGTANTMIKLAASHFKLGDVYECISTSASHWLVKIHGGNGLIAAGDIVVDPGNAGGYID
jgi:hypothetical protein|tara:strand:+ start:8706 stop:9296 length:591 start_codon:yes stop_codon:yes gene_type:complete